MDATEDASAQLTVAYGQRILHPHVLHTRCRGGYIVPHGHGILGGEITGIYCHGCHQCHAQGIMLEAVFKKMSLHFRFYLFRLLFLTAFMHTRIMRKCSCKVMKIYPHTQCTSEKATTRQQKVRKRFGTFTKKAYLCTRFRCYSSVVERILGKDEVPSSTLGSSSETTAEITSYRLSPLLLLSDKVKKDTT